jgi:hypothetical protein
MIGARRCANRSGRVSVKVLLGVLVLAGAGYCGMQFGQPYWRRLQLDSAVQKQLSFAGQIEDDAIRLRLVAEVRDLGLPPEARRVLVTRTEHPRVLHVRISYAETANLLFTTKRLPMTVRAERAF